MNALSPDILGWAATLVLIATLLRQIYTQHTSRSIEAVSKWLFIGQITASTLFVAYSYAVGSMVFVVTNLLVLSTAVLGQVLAVRRRRQANDETARSAADACRSDR